MTICHRQGESNRHLLRAQVRILRCSQRTLYSHSIFYFLHLFAATLVQVKTGRFEGLSTPLPLISNSRIKPSPPPPSQSTNNATGAAGLRLNKFVRRLHDMLKAEKDSGIVEWRRGLLVLFSTDAFAKTILPKYFNTRNFKTFRRQVRLPNFRRYCTSAAASVFHPI